jgi:hypothetical protein
MEIFKRKIFKIETLNYKQQYKDEFYGFQNKIKVELSR